MKELTIKDLSPKDVAEVVFVEKPVRRQLLPLGFLPKTLLTICSCSETTTGVHIRGSCYALNEQQMKSVKVKKVDADYKCEND